MSLTDTPRTAADYLRHIVAAPVYRVAKHTPVEPMSQLSERIGQKVYLKREDLQTVHSFKIRGAFNRMARLTAEESAAGVVTASAGNHAQGVALSGKKLNIRSVIVMPVATPSIKVEAVRSFGGEVVLHGENFDAAQAKARALSAEEGLTYVAPFDDEDVIAGQGTIGLEIFQDLPDVDVVFVPVGGGGIAAGVAVLLKQLRPDIKVVGVEPQMSACLSAALDAGEPITLDRVSLFAEGVAVKRIGDETFRLCREFLDEVITVNSDEISAAVKDIFDDNRAVAEPAGAVSLAGLKKYAQREAAVEEGTSVPHQSSQPVTMVAILSGANLNFHTLRYVSERAEIGEGGEGIFAVSIPEEKGSFLRFSTILGDRTVTEFNYRVGDRNKHRDARIFVGVQLKGGVRERRAIVESLTQAGYTVVDLSDDDLAKVHVRYMIGGKPPEHVRETAYAFEFPEQPRALQNFLEVLGTHWNVTAFHYRSFGMDYGRVLVTFEDVSEDPQFEHHVEKLGYHAEKVSTSPAYQIFLAPESRT